MPEQFRADPSTLRSLILQSGLGFYVPMYQRGFTWGSAEIDRLFEDLHHGIARAANNKSPSTFLGSVITVEDRESVSPRRPDAIPAQVLHTVDGQQRLITLLLVFAVLARKLAEHHKVLATTVEESGMPPDSITQWLLNNLTQFLESLLDAVSIDSYIGENEFRRKPRLIRQDSDVWGNTPGDAKYESDIAWYLMEVIRNRHEGTPQLRVSPQLGRPHLDAIVRAIEGAVEDILQGDTESEELNDLRFAGNTGALDRLIGSNPGPIPDVTVLDDPRRQSLRLIAAASFLLNGVLVIDVRAPDEDYAFALFEPLNTTGQLLTALETLKPLVVQSEGGVVDYQASSSHEHFERLETYFPPQLGTQEKAKLISEFLVSFALAEGGVRLSRSLIDQRQFLRSEYRALGAGANALSNQRAFVSSMTDTATFLFDVWRQEDPALLSAATDMDRLALEILKSTNHTIVIPMLSRYYLAWVRDQSGPNMIAFREILRAVTTFWTLWRTSRSTTKGIDDIHRRLMSQGFSGGATLPPMARRPPGGAVGPPNLPAAADVRAVLRELLTARGQIGSKQDWVAKVTAQPLYQTARGLAKLILLAAHDDFIDDPANPGLIERGVPGTFPCLNVRVWRDHYSVEHIAPQSPSAGDTSYESQIYDEGFTDRLGNLTLMPADLNQLVGNKSWPPKRELYKILSEVSPTERLNQVRAALDGGLAATTQQVLTSAQYLPFCRSLSAYTNSTLTASLLKSRGERIASLAWDRLWPNLT